MLKQQSYTYELVAHVAYDFEGFIDIVILFYFLEDLSPNSLAPFLLIIVSKTVR